jgi:hypothetical protein
VSCCAAPSSLLPRFERSVHRSRASVPGGAARDGAGGQGRRWWRQRGHEQCRHADSGDRHGPAGMSSGKE